MTITFYIRPVARLWQDPRTPIVQHGDVHLLMAIRATLPDWYLWSYGRNRGLWMGAEHFLVLCTLQQAAHLPITSMGMILRLSTFTQLASRTGYDLSEVVYYRQNPHMGMHVPWEPTGTAAQLGYPVGESIEQVFEIPFPIQTGVN